MNTDFCLLQSFCFLTKNCSPLIWKNFSLIFLWWDIHFNILLCKFFLLSFNGKLLVLDLFTYAKILSQTRKHLVWSSAILTLQLHNKTYLIIFHGLFADTLGNAFCFNNEWYCLSGKILHYLLKVLRQVNSKPSHSQQWGMSMYSTAITLPFFISWESQWILAEAAVNK